MQSLETKQTPESTTGFMKKRLSNIPGTKNYVQERVNGLFSDDDFDKNSLTTSEQELFDDSVELKYVPAIREGILSRYKGFFIGAIAPYEFLLIGVVLLSASANSTTGAWYSITLKEMKEKFEGMGMNLTTKLLMSDISANALATYAGIGFAYRTLVYNLFMDCISNPSPENIGKFVAGLVTTGLIHSNLEKILSNKENASVQFDFNDATLAGMTEEQQRFFSQAINSVNQLLGKMDSGKSDIELYRVIYGVLEGLTELIENFNVNDAHKEQFSSIHEELSSLSHNYKGDISGITSSIVLVLKNILGICKFSDDLTLIINGKIAVIEALDSEDENYKSTIVAILHDIIPLITGQAESKGEKLIAEEV